MSTVKQDTAVNSAELGNADLITAQPEAANASAFVTTKLPPPKGDVVPPWPDRPKIRIADGELSTIVDSIESFVATRYYSRAKSIVRIDDGHIQNCAPSYLATEIARICDVERYDARSKDYRKTDLPEKYANAFVERETWPKIRKLSAIVRGPFMRENESICDQPGFDPESECYAHFNPDEFEPLPDNIYEEEAAEALDKLREPFKDFPWETPAAESAFLSHVLTSAIRIALGTSPAYVYTAPDPSTGKTLTSKMAHIISHGEPPKVRTWPKSPEELCKSFLASMMLGDSTVHYDNVGNGTKLRSDELSAILTSPQYSDRKLGASENLTLPNKAVVVFTGNNINPVSDLASRSLVVRLNANMPGSELRKRNFHIPDLESYVLEHRAELLMATLKIVKAHQQSGHVGPTPLPRFEKWSRLVRDALIWLGLPDPCDTQAETDDGSNSLADAFNLLAPKLEGRQFTPADVQAFTMFDKQLAAALFNAGCFDPNSAQRIGYWLRESRDRFGGDFRLRLAASSATSHSSKLYQFTRVRLDPNADLVGDAEGGTR